MSSHSLGGPFLCAGPRCVLGLQPQDSEGTFPPPAPVWWQGLPPAPAALGTHDKSSALLGQPRELALKPRGPLSLGAWGGEGT